MAMCTQTISWKRKHGKASFKYNFKSVHILSCFMKQISTDSFLLLFTIEFILNFLNPFNERHI